VTEAAHRRLGALVSLAALAATLWPLLRDPARGDSFPLSTYPMFAASRGVTHTLDYPVGRTVDGAPRPIRPRHVANAELMQARVAVQRAVGQRRLPALCARIAGNVAADPALADVATVEVVRGRHDALALLLDGVRGPERVLAACPVDRTVDRTVDR
jgi:hypothetical protein